MSEDNKLRLFAVGLLVLVGIMVKFFYDHDKKSTREVQHKAKYLISKETNKR